MSAANLITLARLPLLLLIVALLFVPCRQVQGWGLGLLALLFLMDWLDGYLARLRRQVTELGAVLDVALDRVVENVLWVAFLKLDLVPLWVPVFFLIRSFAVDGVRTAALARGQTVFGMMHSRLGLFLVASRAMRFLYALAKVLTFGALLATHALSLHDPSWRPSLAPWVQGLILLTVALCLARGIPVIVDSRRLFQKS